MEHVFASRRLTLLVVREVFVTPAIFQLLQQKHVMRLLSYLVERLFYSICIHVMCLTIIVQGGKNPHFISVFYMGIKFWFIPNDWISFAYTKKCPLVPPVGTDPLFESCRLCTEFARLQVLGPTPRWMVDGCKTYMARMIEIPLVFHQPRPRHPHVRALSHSTRATSQHFHCVQGHTPSRIGRAERGFTRNLRSKRSV